MERLKLVLELKRLLLLRALGYRYTEDMPLRNMTSSAQSDFTSLEALHEQVRRCHLCDLAKSRRHAVCGKGPQNAQVMFVGEYPGFAEDSSGKPFVGKSGEMLEKMIRNVLGLEPEACYLTYALKCLPPQTSGEHSGAFKERCSGFLHKEIALVAPKVVVALGEHAYRQLTGDVSPFAEVRGVPRPLDRTVCVATHALSFLLRNPGYKKETLHDLRRAAEIVAQTR